jgi:hypothetical protein
MILGGTMDNQVAHTILEQLGGNKFLAMVVKKWWIDNSGLNIKFGRNKSKANLLSIQYNFDTDSYTMTFWRTGKSWDSMVTEVQIFSNVYCDRLQALFTEFTGMATHL